MTNHPRLKSVVIFFGFTCNQKNIPYIICSFSLCIYFFLSFFKVCINVFLNKCAFVDIASDLLFVTYQITND